MKNKEVEDFISRYSRTESELRQTIAYLIRHREQMRDDQLNKLEAKSQKLIEKLNDIDRQKLLEEIKCFKEILALQKQSLERK